jgi:hypothetical protein
VAFRYVLHVVIELDIIKLRLHELKEERVNFHFQQRVIDLELP